MSRIVIKACSWLKTMVYSDDGKIHMWDRHAGEAPVDPIVTLEGHSARANAVCVTETKDNHLVVVSASDDATVRVWTCGKAIGKCLESWARMDLCCQWD